MRLIFWFCLDQGSSLFFPTGGGIWKAGAPSLERGHILGMQWWPPNGFMRRWDQKIFSYTLATKFLQIKWTWLENKLLFTFSCILWLPFVVITKDAEDNFCSRQHDGQYSVVNNDIININNGIRELQRWEELHCLSTKGSKVPRNCETQQCHYLFGCLDFIKNLQVHRCTVYRYIDWTINKYRSTSFPPMIQNLHG